MAMPMSQQTRTGYLTKIVIVTAGSGSNTRRIKGRVTRFEGDEMVLVGDADVVNPAVRPDDPPRSRNFFPLDRVAVGAEVKVPLADISDLSY